MINFLEKQHLPKPQSAVKSCCRDLKNNTSSLSISANQIAEKCRDGGATASELYQKRTRTKPENAFICNTRFQNCFFTSKFRCKICSWEVLKKLAKRLLLELESQSYLSFFSASKRLMELQQEDSCVLVVDKAADRDQASYVHKKNKLALE